MCTPVLSAKNILFCCRRATHLELIFVYDVRQGRVSKNPFPYGATVSPVQLTEKTMDNFPTILQCKLLSFRKARF